MKYQNLFIYLWLILAIMSTSSCMYYMREEAFRSNSSTEDEELIMNSIYLALAGETYIVLRNVNENTAFNLRDFQFIEDKKAFTASRHSVSLQHQKIYTDIKNKKGNVYNSTQRKYADQVHFFVNEIEFDEGENLVTIPIDNVLKLEIYQHDVQTSGITTVLLIVVGAPVVGIALLAILCNCPYVYSQSSDQLVFEGNLFTGSIYPSLERTDYIPILTKSRTEKVINLSVANENKETLNINQLSLLTIEHDSGVKVLIDQEGIPHSISNLSLPIESISFNRYDHTNDLLKADGLAFDFGDPEIHPVTKKSELDLVFKNQENVKNGKLILKVKNNNWGGLIYEEVSSMLGKQFEWYHNREAEKSETEIKESMRKSGMSLSISIFKNGSWQMIDNILPTGSKVYKDVVIPIDLSGLQDEEVRIKLESGFKFWDIDQAFMDFSRDLDFVVYESFPQSLDSEIDQKIINALQIDDDLYMNHLLQDEVINLQFENLNQREGSTYSYFLKGKGYYSVEKDYENRIKIGELLRFRREGGFSAYSFRRYNEFIGSIVIN